MREAGSHAAHQKKAQRSGSALHLFIPPCRRLRLIKDANQFQDAKLQDAPSKWAQGGKLQYPHNPSSPCLTTCPRVVPLRQPPERRRVHPGVSIQFHLHVVLYELLCAECVLPHVTSVPGRAYGGSRGLWHACQVKCIKCCISAGWAHVLRGFSTASSSKPLLVLSLGSVSALKESPSEQHMWGLCEFLHFRLPTVSRCIALTQA